MVSLSSSNLLHSRIALLVGSVVVISGILSACVAHADSELIDLPQGDQPIVTQSQNRAEIQATVRFKSEAARTTQAVVADIDRLTFTVQQLALPERAKSLARSELPMEGGEATIGFSKLAVGPATLMVVVFDRAGKPIGWNRVDTAVKAGVTTVVTMTIALAPTIVPGSGEVRASITISDGQEIVSPPTQETTVPSPTPSPQFVVPPTLLPIGTVKFFPKGDVWVAPLTTLTGDLPASEIVTLAACRLDSPAPPPAAAAAALALAINGVPITPANGGSLLNKLSSFTLGSNVTSTYLNSQLQAWNVFLSPDFNYNNWVAGPFQVVSNPGQAYRYVFNVKPWLLPGASTMRLSVSNVWPGTQAGTVPSVSRRMLVVNVTS